jgi:DNA-directed RNA polymerase specialized sigma24 family protein
MSDHLSDQPSSRNLNGAAAPLLDQEEFLERSPASGPRGERAPPSVPPPSQVRIAEAEPVVADTPPEIDRRVLLKRLSHPKLRRELLTYLVKKKELIPDRAEDIVQNTYLRAVRARSWPDDEGKMFAWMKAIADRSFVDDLRKRERRDEVEELHEDVDVAGEPRGGEHAREVARVARSLGAKSPYNAATLEMIETEADGEPLGDILAERSISKEAYRRRKNRFIALVKKRLVEIASLSTGSMGLLLMFHVLTFVVVGMVGAAPPVPGPSDPLPTLPSQQEDAGTLRYKALGRCRSQDYAGCLGLLNRARKLDPQGEHDPSVVSARHEAEAAVRSPATPMQR